MLTNHKQTALFISVLTKLTAVRPSIAVNGLAAFQETESVKTLVTYLAL